LLGLPTGNLCAQTKTSLDINQQLFQAAQKGDKAAVESLLAAKADVNAKRKDGGNALMLAAVKDRRRRLSKHYSRPAAI